MSRDSFISSMEEVVTHLEVVASVWGEARDMSEERRESELARIMLNKIDQEHLHRYS